jgi:uncharacterized protein (TIGR02001 family)
MGVRADSSCSHDISWLRLRPNAPGRSVARAHVHGQCRHLQRIHLPRHRANRRESRRSGGFDYAHASGLYAGTWASNISSLEDFGAYNRSSLEWDFYGGYRSTFPNSDFFYDVGGYDYVYPGRRDPGVVDVDTWELYGAVGWKWASVKVSYALTDYFGARPTGQKTDGTWYVDGTATYPIGDTGVAVIGHVGYLDVRHDGNDNDFTTGGKVSYTDWKLGVSYTVPDGLFKNVEIGVYYTGNDASKRFYTDLTGYNTAKDRGVVYVKKTF